MRKTLIITLLFLFTSINCLSFDVERTSAGVLNSYKGFGFYAKVPSDAFSWHSFQLYADIYGMPSGLISSPGVLFNYSKNQILHTDANDGFYRIIHAGPGIAIGYANDSGKNRPGVIAGLSGNAGCLWMFDSGFGIDVSLSLIAGLHVRKDKSLSNNILTFYNNGLYESWLPLVSIFYKF